MSDKALLVMEIQNVVMNVLCLSIRKNLLKNRYYNLYMI